MADQMMMTTTTQTNTSIDICLQNYKWFINSAQCTNSSLTQLSDVEQRLLTLIDKIPVFVDKANIFSEEAKSITKRWREASLMLSKHAQVLEFLEIPQLMETCVRNNCYEEALQLYSYVHKLERRYGSTIPLIS
ncbi:conserved oligomeric Golgi complex subunit 8-like protein, partial [Leptotrombidium deliense]